MTFLEQSQKKAVEISKKLNTILEYRNHIQEKLENEEFHCLARAPFSMSFFSNNTVSLNGYRNGCVYFCSSKYTFFSYDVVALLHTQKELFDVAQWLNSISCNLDETHKGLTLESEITHILKTNFVFLSDQPLCFSYCSFKNENTSYSFASLDFHYMSEDSSDIVNSVIHTKQIEYLSHLFCLLMKITDKNGNLFIYLNKILNDVEFAGFYGYRDVERLVNYLLKSFEKLYENFQYLENFNTSIEDISPLSSLHNIKELSL